MGRIVEGRITGTLPDRVAFAVDYPGYPSSVERAIQTLGGEEGLAKVRTSESNFIELKFRPEDPFAHPAFGELRHTSDLVLRLSRKTVKNPVGQRAETSNSVNSSEHIVEHNETGERRIANEEFNVQAHEVAAEIVAKVEHTYTFDGMADYQYVMAVHADGINNQKPKGMEDIPVKEVDPNEMTMLVPPLFSTKDIPEEIFLRHPVGRKRKQLTVDIKEGEEEMPAPCFALDFTIQEVPKEGNWELNLQRGSEPWLRTAALVRVFQERPIWTRTMLNERLIEQGMIVTEYYLKTLLFRIAYYFGSGPFRNLWIRNGYDPRSDPESRAHQIIDFRVPFVLRGQIEAATSQPMKSSFSDLCTFKVVPQKKFTQFQLVDMQDDDIQAQIKSPPERTTCSETTGWYRLSTIKRLRQIIRLRFLALYPGRVARALESVERRNWERARLAPETEEERPIDDNRSNVGLRSVPETGQESSHRTSEEGNQMITTESRFAVPDQVTGVDLSGIDDDEDDDEEDEGDIGEDVDQLDEDGLKANLDEDEEEEEELEEDMEGLLPGQGDAEDEAAPYLNPTDNIPKNYLQALLGKFASNSNGGDRPSAMDLDDDEQYTIFEEDDDEDE
ncbi:unnamed protein product [Calypogeia fissa]